MQCLLQALDYINHMLSASLTVYKFKKVMDTVFPCYNVYIECIPAKPFKERQAMQHNHPQVKLFVS